MKGTFSGEATLLFSFLHAVFPMEASEKEKEQIFFFRIGL